MSEPKEPTIGEQLAKIVNDNDKLFISAQQQAVTGSLLIPVASTFGKVGQLEALPSVEAFSEANAPTVVIVVRATPDAADNVAALLARYRGDDPKAGTPRKGWFW